MVPHRGGAVPRDGDRPARTRPREGWPDEPDPAVVPHPGATVTADEAFSDQLEQWLSSDGTKTLGTLGDVFAEKSFAVTILVLMFVPALPLPTGGITHVFEVITVVLAAQLAVGRTTIWLPERCKRRELGAATTGKAIPFMVRRVRWFERFSGPRLHAVFTRRWSRALIGVFLMGLAVAAALAPPFSGLDTLPSLGAVAVALAIILEDAVVLAIGAVIGTVGILLIVTLGAVLLRLVSVF